jgi:predicted  nucleic acid-binding Zn-ribbon protein
MDELEGWQAAMQKADRDIAELRDQLEVEENAVNHLHTDRNNLRLEVERLRAERDDARRRLCAELLEVEGHPFGWKGASGAKGIAERLGWDCFKEKP